MGSPSVSAREWAVVIVGGATLAFTAWAMGGVQLWSLHTLFAGGLLTFILALVPGPSCYNGTDGEHGNARNLKRLLRFPFFWFSLAFLLYVTVQGLNPAWVQIRDERGWWMEAVEAIAWLPTGAKTGYEPMNAFRVLVNFSAAFFLVWGLWVGIRRRQSALLILWILVLSGVAMAFVAILQKFSGADAVLWTVPSANIHFWGTFFYRNQGVAYLILIILSCAVLYFYHFNQTEKRAETGGPHLLLFIFVAVVYTSICLALSRGGILFGGILTGCFFIFALARWLFSHSFRNSLLITALVAVVLSYGVYRVVRYVDVKDIRQRFGDIGETLATADEDSRALTTKITWKMAQEELWLGWGAGSWRYIFPMYQKSYPQIYYVRYNPRQGWTGRKFYRYAHNDIVQFLYEFGIVGYSLLFLALSYWIWCLLFRSAGNAMSALMVFVGLGVVAGHAFVDFIFQSPAYWMAFNGVLCASVKLLALHRERSYG